MAHPARALALFLAVATALVLGVSQCSRVLANKPGFVPPFALTAIGVEAMAGPDGRTIRLPRLPCRTVLEVRDGGGPRVVVTMLRMAFRPSTPGTGVADCVSSEGRFQLATPLWGRTLVDGTDGHVIPYLDTRRQRTPDVEHVR
jgi:hypothetical protein